MANRRMIFLAGLVLAALPATGASAQLTDRSPSVVESITKEFRDLRGGYADYKNSRVSGDLLVDLQGADHPERLANGNYFLSSCRMHSCSEMGAVIVKPDGTMVAATMINSHCGDVPHCLDKDVLTIFVKRKNNTPAVTQVFQGWADRMGSEYRRTLYPHGFGKTEIRIIPERAPK